MQMLESWLKSYVGQAHVWWIEIIVIVFSALVLGYVANRIILKLEERANRSKTVWDDAFIEAFRRPAVWFIWIVGVNLAAIIGSRRTGSDWQQILVPANKVVVVFLVALFLVQLIKRAERNLVHPEYMAEPLDETTVQAVGKLLRATVIISAVLICMQVFGYSISGVIAFGGVGGLAVGFAAKDLLANFFGAIMIYLDRPFAVGDWVRSPDREIEGTVEDIGWRLTRIRTFDKRPLYVPNSVFNQVSLENPSRMLNRRIFETVGIRYCDVAALPSIVAEVKAMLENHEEIDQQQTLIVNFNKFASSSLDFFVYTFTRTVNWVHYHQVKQDVLFRVAGIIESHGAEVAFPTSTVHLPDTINLANPELPGGNGRNSDKNEGSRTQ
jgi:MscS family membrane protein